jgi:hypothetical protein
MSCSAYSLHITLCCVHISDITRMALALGVAPEAVGSGGAATETAGAASTMVAPTAAPINGATAANHECKQVSAFMCTPMRLYGKRCARVTGCGWAYLCARRRSRRSARPSEPSSEAGTRLSDGQGCILESAHPLGIAASPVSIKNHAVHRNRITCARVRSRELQNARANDSSSYKDRGDTRRLQGHARIETQLT